ncbi:hypothetical protein ACM66B_006570 [Microbotryomycetes sp. NB124-2]
MEGVERTEQVTSWTEDRDEDDEMRTQRAATTATVTARTWTIDSLLEEARRLHKVTTPLFTWQDLRQVVQTLRLDVLRRHPSLEILYTTHFNPLIKAEYGSTEAYLRMQLGWPLSTSTTPSSSFTRRESEWWTSADEAVVRRNDWAYGVPSEVQHHVVWVQKALFNPALCRPERDTDEPERHRVQQQQHEVIQSAQDKCDSLMTPPGTPTKERGEEVDFDLDEQDRDSWPFVLQYGLAGETGFSDEQTMARDGPGREIDAFVRRTWPESDFETLWFANPPTLQSVRGLAHFHVLVRQHSPGTSWEERDS